MQHQGLVSHGVCGGELGYWQGGVHVRRIKKTSILEPKRVVRNDGDPGSKHVNADQLFSVQCWVLEAHTYFSKL
jgi:hypothetical protein